MITYGRCIKVSSVRCPHRIKYPKLSGSPPTFTHHQTQLEINSQPFKNVNCRQIPTISRMATCLWQSWVPHKQLHDKIAPSSHLFPFLITISSRSLGWWLMMSCNRSKWTIQSLTFVHLPYLLLRSLPKELLSYEKQMQVGKNLPLSICR